MANIKTPAEIAETVLDEHAIQSHWNRSGAQIALLIEEAIEADRKQRPTMERWGIELDGHPDHVEFFNCDEAAAKEIAEAWGSVSGTVAMYTARKAGE